jgi:hypothetical protein
MNKEIREKKAGFNIIDVLIILFLILAAVGIVLRFNLTDKINLNAKGDIFEIEFVTMDNIQEASQDYLKPGVKFYINIESIEIGMIKEILEIRNPAQGVEKLVNGDLLKTDLPGRIDVRGIMESRGRSKDEGVMINGNSFVAPGKEYFIHTGMLEVGIRIVSIKKVN